MNLSRLMSACCATLLAAAVPAPIPADAAPIIQRCQSAEGEVIYTDVGCVALGAKSLPMRSELLARIAREETLNADSGEGAERIRGLAPFPPPRRAAAEGCARTSTQLAMDLQGAVAMGDVNRIAESYHWAGLSGSQARHILDRLERLGAHALVQARFYDATIGGSDLQLASAGPDMTGNSGVMQLTYEQDGSVHAVDLDVHRYRGCYFVRF